MEKPSMYLAGQSITLVTSDRTYTFIVDRPFIPFTKSITVLARSEEFAPNPVVVKIFDSRFLDERLDPPARLWSLAVEQAAAALPLDTNEDTLWRPEPEDPDGQAERAALWEKSFIRLSQECYESESGAYQALQPLQGSEIPRLLLTGTILPPDERAVHPHAVVLEYIPDAVTLADIAADLLDYNLCDALVRVVDSFAAYNVYHNDLNNANNVLFSPRDRPVRAIIIDFGCAGVKEDGEDEETWQFNVGFAADSKYLKRRSAEKGVVIPNEELWRYNKPEALAANSKVHLEEDGVFIANEGPSSA